MAAFSGYSCGCCLAPGRERAGVGVQSDVHFAAPHFPGLQLIVTWAKPFPFLGPVSTPVEQGAWMIPMPRGLYWLHQVTVASRSQPRSRVLS